MYLEPISCVFAMEGLSLASSQCPYPIPGSERRDCYPWESATQPACENRGCVWCNDTVGFPSCFYNDWVSSNHSTYSATATASAKVSSLCVTLPCLSPLPLPIIVLLLLLLRLFLLLLPLIMVFLLLLLLHIQLPSPSCCWWWWLCR